MFSHIRYGKVSKASRDYTFDNRKEIAEKNVD